MGMTFNNIEDVYYGSSDGDFETFLGLNIGELNSFGSVIGGCFFLNFLPYIKPKRIELVDCNKYSVEMCKAVIESITKAENTKDLFELFKNGNYKCNPKIRSDLQRLGEASLSGNWDEMEFIGRKRDPIVKSWQYAFDRFKELQSVIREAEVNYHIMDIKKLDVDVDFMWYSNVITDRVQINRRGFYCFKYHYIAEVYEMDSIREINISDYPDYKLTAEKEGLCFYDEEKMTHYGYFKNNKLISFNGILPKTKTNVELKNSFTHPLYRKQGIYTLLNNHRREQVKKSGYKEFTAWSTKASLNIQLRAGAKQGETDGVYTKITGKL